MRGSRPERDDMTGICIERRKQAGQMASRFHGAVLLMLLCGALTAQGATLVLQEGVNGYSGCIDSHTHKNGYSSGQTQNYGDSRDLLFGNESYQSA
jgi:hypothetical protein